MPPICMRSKNHVSLFGLTELRFAVLDRYGHLRYCEGGGIMEKKIKEEEFKEISDLEALERFNETMVEPFMHVRKCLDEEEVLSVL